MAATSTIEDIWLKYDVCRLFKPSSYIKTLTPIQYAILDEENELIQLKLMKIGGVFIQLSLHDTIVRDGPPFNLNLRYAKVIDNNKLVKFKYDDPEEFLSIKWPTSDNVQISSEKIVQSNGTSYMRPFWNVKFHLPKNDTTDADDYDDDDDDDDDENVFVLCEWQWDPYYWMLNYLDTNCTKVQFDLPILLAIDYRSYFYLFFHEHVIIIPKRILLPFDHNHGKHLVRFTRKSNNRFFICPDISTGMAITRFHDRHPYIYPIYIIQWDESDGQEQPEDPLLASLSAKQLAMFHDRNEDKLPRAIPIIQERPKFKLILTPKPPMDSSEK
ncbi:hypothetical protein DERF_002433 [Dermatophagoides farinae]|uniref:Uncharacterized protein n=1 Tax=Dermatophagoides farinae TaxID=6954 RepID=A0A922LAM0_DERFA|nr:hypothetical protein DERF_002433 [Dermatophagoides farinae]